MLSKEQLQKIALLSDTVLYPEAVAFIQYLVREGNCNPLPTSQVTGLLSIAESFKYDELYRFMLHQRDRNWPPSRSDIKTLYTELEKVLSLMQRRRLRDEFRLLTDGLSVGDARQEVDMLMAALSREFIQHLVAENVLLATEKSDERARERTNRR